MSLSSTKPSHSRILFVQDDGSPMRFYVRPGPVKRQLSPLITHGGGVMCRVQEPGAILLAEPGEAKGSQYISTNYIGECVKSDERLEVEHYRLGQEDNWLRKRTGKGKQTDSESDKNGEDHQGNLVSEDGNHGGGDLEGIGFEQNAIGQEEGESRRDSEISLKKDEVGYMNDVLDQNHEQLVKDAGNQVEKEQVKKGGDQVGEEHSKEGDDKKGEEPSREGEGHSMEGEDQIGEEQSIVVEDLRADEHAEEGEDKRGEGHSKKGEDQIGEGHSENREDQIGEGHSENREDQIGEGHSENREDQIGEGHSENREDQIGEGHSENREDQIGEEQSMEGEDQIGEESSREGEEQSMEVEDQRAEEHGNGEGTSGGEEHLKEGKVQGSEIHVKEEAVEIELGEYVTHEKKQEEEGVERRNDGNKKIRRKDGIKKRRGTSLTSDVEEKKRRFDELYQSDNSVLENVENLANNWNHQKTVTSRSLSNFRVGRIPFTEQEDVAILTYIRDFVPARGTVSGVRLWQEMEEMKVVNRTWQSMKHRYKKYLVENQSSYILPESSGSHQNNVTSSVELFRKNSFRNRSILFSSFDFLSPEKSSMENVSLESSPEALRQKEGTNVSRLQGNTDHGDAQQSSTPLIGGSNELVMINKNADVTSNGDSEELHIFEIANMEFEVEDEHKVALKQSLGLKEFVMENDSISPDSLTQVDEVSSSPDLSQGESLQKALHDMMSEFKLTLCDVTQALIKNNGEVLSTKYFLQTGTRPDGYPIWVRKDDLDLKKDDPTFVERLVQKYGADNVAKRMAFLAS
ncbi:telomeric repeat-binding factor 2-interacting protein 1 [Pelobates fuscus]|uniref:telomeric repeat-binding factor 2-interacting protein 1 n=1 Tax=Pelobates fuscus TaxID=191477 RepID=UPI002FE43171